MNWKLVCIVLTVSLGVWLYEPVPEGFSQPWKFRARMALDKVIFTIVYGLDYCGICMVENVLRSLISLQSGAKVTFPENVSVTDETLEGVKVRMYQPKDTSTNPQIYPGLVYYHGGGWVLGDTLMFDSLMRDILAELDVVIISVEYRLAPEFKFPIPLEDCLVVTKHVLKNADKFNIDPSRVAIGGDSAGGNLAAAVALKLRDEEFPILPKHQILLYPVLQVVDTELPSMVQYANGFLTTRVGFSRVISLYGFGSLKYARQITDNTHVSPEDKKMIFQTKIRHDDLPKDFLYEPYTRPDLSRGDPEVWKEVKDVLANPYVSPLLADDLSGLPQTYMFTAHNDVLRDEGFLYVKRLRDAGVRVTHVHGWSNLHAACSIKHMFPKEAGECITNLVKYLRTL